MRSKILKFLFNRLMVTLYVVVVEILIIALLFAGVREKIDAIEIVFRILSTFIVLHILRNSDHISFDMFWILIVIMFPLPGTAAYVFLNLSSLSSKTFRRISAATKKSAKYYVQDPSVTSKVDGVSENYRGQLKYISDSAKFPIYSGTRADYYPTGEAGYPVMLEELKKAKKFIFMEYFIIGRGEMWDGILEILVQKVAEGVDVRVMYDDLGSYNTLLPKYRKKLVKMGIKCISFNHVNPAVNGIMNHRDHRKILIVDGEVAFSGGINIADEYINKKERFGYWKDNCIRIRGRAVRSMTIMFLTTWNAVMPTDEDFSGFLCDAEEYDVSGFVAPYCDSPLDGERVGQNVYINILNQAKDYVYIMTPYLIIDNELINSLVLAAKRGVDVRLIVPGIPDKKVSYEATKSYFRTLIRGGVKIYEFTPGFVHSKIFVSDDAVAVVGSVNLDYRSLYLHFENAIFLCGSDVVAEVKKDAVDTIEQCKLIEYESCKEGVFRAFFRSVLRVFAPML